MIHARLIGDVWRFRVWSTICDAYISEEMTAKRIERELLPHYTVYEISSGYAKKDIAKRLARTTKNGTSSMIPGDKQDVHGPWATEKCEKCNGFHHEFATVGEVDWRCKVCGERRHMVQHGPKCERSRR